MRFLRYTYPAYRSQSLPAPAAAFVRSPWTGLESEIDRLFASAHRDFTGTAGFPLDLYEDEANAYLRAELPGFSRDDIQLEVADGQLTLTAARKSPAAAGQPASSRALRRAVALGDTVQAYHVSAAYEHGVLTVTLPKREEAKPKKITIAVK